MRLHIDLCSGLGGWQAPFKESSEWRSVGLDIREDLEADIIADVRHLPLRACQPTLVTASPPCTEFTRFDLPWHDDPDPSMELVKACLSAIRYLNPDYWILENVRGLHRYWRPARVNYGAFYLWGEFPFLNVESSWKGKMDTSGSNPEERARIPYQLANAVRVAIERWG